MSLKKGLAVFFEFLSTAQSTRYYLHKLSFILVFLFVILIGVTIMFNNSQPTNKDHILGIKLTHHLKQSLSSSSQKVLFDAAKNIVNINVYGLINIDEQDKLIKNTRNLVDQESYDGAVIVNFFPSREEIKTEVSPGVVMGKVIQKKSVRTLTIQKGE